MSLYSDLPTLPDSMDSVSDVLSDLSDATFLDDFVNEESEESNIAHYSDSLLGFDFNNDHGGASSSSKSPQFDRAPSFSPFLDEDVDTIPDGNGTHKDAGGKKASRSSLSPLEFLPTEVSASWLSGDDTKSINFIIAPTRHCNSCQHRRRSRLPDSIKLNFAFDSSS